MYRKHWKRLVTILVVVALFAVVGIAVLLGLRWLDHNPVRPLSVCSDMPEDIFPTT